MIGQGGVWTGPILFSRDLVAGNGCAGRIQGPDGDTSRINWSCVESGLCLRITPKEHFKADLSERTNEIRGGERGRKRDGGRRPNDGGAAAGGEGKGGAL